MSSQRKSYSFKDGLTMMAAKAVGIEPELAAAAGENARAVINALRHAQKARNTKDRDGYVREAQAELRAISPQQHPQLVNALNARLLALQGRGGDTEIAHLTPGEIVLPRSMQTPSLMKQIAELARRNGRDPRSLEVGSHAESQNPNTGMGEHACYAGDPGECGIGAFNNYGWTGEEHKVVTFRAPNFNGGIPGVPAGPILPPNFSIGDGVFRGIAPFGPCSQDELDLYERNNTRSVELADALRAIDRGRNLIRSLIDQASDPSEKQSLEDTLKISDLVLEATLKEANELIAQQKVLSDRCSAKDA